MDTFNQKVRNFLRQYIGAPHFSDDDDIFSLGFVNSLFAMQLIAWVETEFQVKIEDADLELANFNSVNAIAHFARRKIEALPQSEAQPA